jgi:salicylate hydroxylase
MGSTPEKLRIAIIGGGISGLALAAGLCKKPHLSVHVYEAVAEYKGKHRGQANLELGLISPLDIGAGLAIHKNGITAMATIGPDVRQAYFDKATTNMEEEEQEVVTQVILAQGPHMGTLVGELGRAKGRKSVSRADLLAGLLALIPPECISFGKRLVHIGECALGNNTVVVLGFEDRSIATADCVLGADGIHSVVRAHVLGPEDPAVTPKNRDGWRVYRTLVSTEEARKHIDEKYTRTVPILLGPEGHINCIPLNKGTRLSAGVAVRDPTGEIDGLDPEDYHDYSEEAQQIVRLVAKDTTASWSVADHDHAEVYYRGGVAIIGDAAHAALPFAGNGAAQALEDAAVLNCLFDEVAKPAEVDLALSAYDKVRRPRSQAAVEMARTFGRVYAYATEDEMHRDPERMREFFRGAAASTNEFDVVSQNTWALDHYRERQRLRFLCTNENTGKTGAGEGCYGCQYCTL